MSWRVVVINSRSKLELKNNFLVIRNETVKRVHIDEISVLLIENTGSAVTVSLLEALWEAKIAIIFCDNKRNPGAQLIPYYNSHDCSASIHSQIQWEIDTRNLIWAEIVREKINNQAEVLRRNGKKEYSEILKKYSTEIEYGDETNREGHAAKVYFNALFGNSFSRSNECYTNYALNYGYAILLSVVNREIAACGYLTQLGIFHKNVFNPFNLACDLMEPFRPLFDSFVIKMPEKQELDHQDKLYILGILNEKVYINKAKNTVLNAIRIYVRSVLDALNAKDSSLIRFFDYEF